MANKHRVTLTVEVEMEEMDGTVEQSAEIAQDIVSDLVTEQWDGNAVVLVSSYREVDDTPGMR